MFRLLILLFLAVPAIAFSQAQVQLMRLNQQEYDSFPNKFDVTQLVFKHYFDIGFKNKQLDSLNDAQKVLCYHFVCDGLIGNSGFYSILLETRGEFNTGYLTALEQIGDTADKEIFAEIVEIYNKYERWFSNRTTPPVFDDDTTEYDKKLLERIEKLEQKWYLNEKKREDLFSEYMINNKQSVVNRQ